MRYLLALMLVAAMSAAAFAYDLEGVNISETEGFQVTRQGSKITLLNNTGRDAYRVYVLVYSKDEGHPTFRWDQTVQAEHAIPVVPAGFKVYIKTQEPKGGRIASKYYARVYCEKEYWAQSNKCGETAISIVKMGPASSAG